MKRVLKFLVVLQLVFCVLTGSAGADHTYYLDELGMSVDIPEDLAVFTRDMQNDDHFFSEHGLDRDGFLSAIIEGNIYLDAWDEAVDYEIVITMIESPLGDFNLFTDAELSTWMDSLKPEYESAGSTLIKSEIYQHSQAKFLKVYQSQPYGSDRSYGLQYYTTYNNKAINVTLHSYTGEINQHQEALLKKIVDTVRFDTEPQVYVPPVQTDAFRYTDKNTGLSFTVPANWTEVPLDGKGEYVAAVFASNLVEGPNIIFACKDVFGSEEGQSVYSPIEKLFLTRSAVDNSVFDMADIAEILGCTQQDVSTATYGGKEYYFAQRLVPTDVSGKAEPSSVLQFIRCENGYMYMFQFWGLENSALFADFEALLDSAEYPPFEDDLSFPVRTIEICIAVGILVLAAVVTLCAFLIHRRKRKGRTDIRSGFAPGPCANGEYAAEEGGRFGNPPELAVDGGQDDHRSVRFCHHCGYEVPGGSRFCHICGARLLTEEEE